MSMYGGVFEGDITDEIGAKLIEPFSFFVEIIAKGLGLIILVSSSALLGCGCALNSILSEPFDRSGSFLEGEIWALVSSQ